MITHKDVYGPLLSGSRTIRRLLLLPGLWNDRIEVQLREETIADARDRYIAISYTWGAQGTVKQVKIICNRVPVYISWNLYTILRRLRQPDDCISVWADALCINQEDPSERTHQVGLMSEIYKNSRETVIWLGEQTASDDAGETNPRFYDSYVAVEDLTRIAQGATPRVAWQDNENDQRLLDAYLAAPAQSHVKGKDPNDIFGAFCLIQSFAQGTSDSFLRCLEEKKTVVSHFHGRLSKIPRVWAGLERLMSRPWVFVESLVTVCC
jgi:hypothetical protein